MSLYVPLIGPEFLLAVLTITAGLFISLNKIRLI